MEWYNFPTHYSAQVLQLYDWELKQDPCLNFLEIRNPLRGIQNPRLYIHVLDFLMWGEISVSVINCLGFFMLSVPELNIHLIM